MRDMNFNAVIRGDVYNFINDNSQTSIINNEMQYEQTEVHKEETSVGTIIKEKVIEALVGVVLTTSFPIFHCLQENRILDKWTAEVSIVLLIIAIIFSIIGLVVCVISVVNIFIGVTLLDKGNHVELQSNMKWIGKVMDSLLGDNSGAQQDERTVEKFFINADGKIYEIVDKVCPICETEPVGKMRLIYSNSGEKYFWRCMRNPVHKVEFDYTKAI